MGRLGRLGIAGVGIPGSANAGTLKGRPGRGGSAGSAGRLGIAGVGIPGSANAGTFGIGKAHADTLHSKHPSRRAQVALCQRDDCRRDAADVDGADQADLCCLHIEPPGSELPPSVVVADGHDLLVG